MENGLDIQIPQHVAIIMDGNGRWAQARHMPRVEGHRQGAKTVRMVVEESRRIGVRYLSLYAFSTENWQRPKEEVWALMKLFEKYLVSELDLLNKNGIRLRIIGNRDRLPEGVQKAAQHAEEATAKNTDMDLILAVSYGGREELVAAAQAVAKRVATGEILPEEISEDDMRAGLYAPTVPDPDVLIRTSDESRISNFLLWQLAYSEIVVSDVCWPDFSKETYLGCLRQFSSRSRRYGLTEEQIAEQAGASEVL